MKKIKINIKKIMTVIGIMMLFSLVIFGAKLGIEAQRELRCTDLEVDIDYSQGIQFVDQEDVLESVKQNAKGDLVGKGVRDLGLSGLERELESNPYIETAESFIKTNGEVVLEIEQKEPILRVINSVGVSYYISHNKQSIPLSDKFTPRLLIVSGELENQLDTKERTTDKLHELHSFLSNNPFWLSMIDQLYISEKGELEMIPVLGSHRVLMGRFEFNMEDKFSKLEKFYKEGLNKVGWNEYKLIDIRYKDQIICKKKNA